MKFIHIEFEFKISAACQQPICVACFLEYFPGGKRLGRPKRIAVSHQAQGHSLSLRYSWVRPSGILLQVCCRFWQKNVFFQVVSYFFKSFHVFSSFFMLFQVVSSEVARICDYVHFGTIWNWNGVWTLHLPSAGVRNVFGARVQPTSTLSACCLQHAYVERSYQVGIAACWS